MKNVQVVTGGTSGMGFACAKALGELGCVLIGGRNERRMTDALDKLEEAGIEAYAMHCDVSNRAIMSEFAAYAASLGRIDTVVNAAGVDGGGPELIAKIDVGGTVNTTEAFFPLMENARLVNFSSVTGRFFMPSEEDKTVWDEPNDPDFVEKFLAATAKHDIPLGMEHMGEDYLYYTAGKAFVIYYTQANACRFGKKGSSVFSVAPGAFETPMLLQQSNNDFDTVKKGNAFGRYGMPEEMAELVLRLVQPGIQYLTGTDIAMDGGLVAKATVRQLD